MEFLGNVKGLLLLLLLSNSLSTYAFTLNNNVGAHFKHNSVSISVVSGTCTNIGMSESELLELAVEGGNRFWNRAPTSALVLHRGGVVSAHSDFKTGLLCSSENPCIPNSNLITGHDIVIACNTNLTNFNNSIESIAASVPVKVEGDAIRTAVILVNDDANNQFQYLSHNEKVSVLAHEMGHSLGLGHSPVRDSLMFYELIPVRERLGGDDIDGISYLYPQKQPKALGCGSIEQVPPSNTMASMLLGIAFVVGFFRIRRLGFHRS